VIRYSAAGDCEVLCAVFRSWLIAALQHGLQRDWVAQVRRPEAAGASCVLIWAEVCGVVGVALHFRWRRYNVLAVGVAATCSNPLQCRSDFISLDRCCAMCGCAVVLVCRWWVLRPPSLVCDSWMEVAGLIAELDVLQATLT
jgi:hypothetical protein